MRIINIIVSEPETPVVSIDSFAIFEEQLSSDVAKEAEDFFIEKAVFLKYGNEFENETRKDLAERNFFREEVAETLDDGYTEVGTRTISLAWSDV